MDSIPALILVAETFGQEAGLERTTVSWRLFGDSKKLDALISGSDIQTRRFEAALRWLSENWPATVEWPEQVRRPLSPVEPAAVDGRNMAPAAAHGAENPERNVSRTDEPGSSAAATTLYGPTAAKVVPQVAPVEGAASDNAVVGATPGRAGDASVHCDPGECVASGPTAGLREFRGVEVCEADLNPTVAAATTDSFDTEAVAVANINDGAAEGSTLGQLDGHGSAIRNSLAGVGESGCSDQADSGCQQDETCHSASLSDVSYREVSA